ncbi:MAG: hypothetical protein FDZ75_00860 [Actinobacteria bacterium]|nr:MAG: hypothetical protein FDZ75_00860 [Actinomycetota bacterium]
MQAPDRDISAALEGAEQRAATPIAGAIAGILFALTFATSMVILVSTLPSVTADTGQWLAFGVRRFRFALGLLPFSGLFFLWFIAVARDRLGRHEDQFFATVFLGSGLLFLAMIFSAAALAGGLAAAYASDPTGFAGSQTYLYARTTIAQVFNVYALRMAAVFILSQATLWLRVRVMPRWLAFISYAVALTLMLVMSRSPWIVLVFPAWGLLVSTYILAVNVKTRS